MVTNRTVVPVKSFTGDVGPRSLASVLARVRAAIGRDEFAEGLNVNLLGPMTPVRVAVAAPLRVTGVARVRGRSIPVSGLLDGLRRKQLRVALPASSKPPKIELRVRTAPVPDLVSASGDLRARLAATIALELTYARARQFDQFLASPDQTGPSSATYVFRSAAPPAASARPATGSKSHAPGWIVLGLGLALAVPVGLVAWAHS